MTDYTEYIESLYDSIDDETSWTVLLPLLRGLVDDTIQLITEQDEYKMPVKSWLGAVLVELKRNRTNKLPDVLKAMQAGSRAAYGDVRERVGDVTVIGSGPFSRKIYDDTEAMCLSSFGALCWRLGNALKR